MQRRNLFVYCHILAFGKEKLCFWLFGLDMRRTYEPGTSIPVLTSSQRLWSLGGYKSDPTGYQGTFLFN
ncbi:hypothetical protein HanXRQr2_Chr13g0618651 [Helianthus annuus]|uniref:Uncharacterized protein n=1 Tax=Helianthus annuus TaxID=4232 RepID=A0A9K3HE79_HELAN|nr:hypothetical protein HanXRQr2_Chr13g0618651 [Helianthus annuus]